MAPNSRGREKTRPASFREPGTLILPRRLEAGLKCGHPWVYRNHVPDGFHAETGTWVRARAGGTDVIGLWDNESQIALRVYLRQGRPGPELIEQRLVQALALRQPLRATDTNAYRVVNGEGDALPAVVVDRYGNFVVIATYCRSVETLVPWFVDALVRLLSPRGILWRRRSGEPDERDTCELLQGELPPDGWTVTENGMRYHADLLAGHKTGLYLDQRDNRSTLRKYIDSSDVLNLFSYTGGFSLAAALAGAKSVTSVDTSAKALERAQDNFGLNGLDAARHRFVEGDCYDVLRSAVAAGERFDVVVCDPPSLARSRAQLDQALKAYVRLNALGLQVVRSGGYYCASSCTAQVSQEAFRNALADAAQRAHCEAQIVHEAGHALDHPISLGHTEGRYLKFIILRISR